MKKTILLLLTLFGVSLSSTADSETKPPKDNGTVILKPIRKPGKGSYAPAMPLYGEYVNPELRLFVDDSEDSRYTLTISKDNLEVESVTISGVELNTGYSVSVTAPFEIALSVENGVTYVGEVL